VNACKRVNKQNVIHLLELGIYITLGMLYYDFLDTHISFARLPEWIFYRHAILRFT
jgi:hypothetical protein